MRYKFRIAIPFCFIFVVALIAGYFSLTTWAGTEGASAAEPVSVAVETVAAENLNAPAKVMETVAPQETVNESDFNPESALEEDDSVVVTGDSGYILDDSERIAVECAVMCEAGGEGIEGQMMVAQSILDGSLRNGFNVYQTISCYEIHSTSYSKVTDEVREAVSRVFDDGERITEEKADLWYAPALVESPWHEEQQYIITVGGHRFFWMNSDMDA